MSQPQICEWVQTPFLEYLSWINIVLEPSPWMKKQTYTFFSCGLAEEKFAVNAALIAVIHHGVWMKPTMDRVVFKLKQQT